MAMPKEPGKPSIEIALKLMSKKRIKDEEDKKSSTAKKPMTEQEMMEETSPVYGRSAMVKRLTGADANTSNTSSPYKEKIIKEDLIKEGLFIEKNGSLFPTDKYYEYKKTGKLKGKFNIN